MGTHFTRFLKNTMSYRKGLQETMSHYLDARNGLKCLPHRISMISLKDVGRAHALLLCVWWWNRDAGTNSKNSTEHSPLHIRLSVLTGKIYCVSNKFWRKFPMHVWSVWWAMILISTKKSPVSSNQILTDIIKWRVR